METAIVVVSTLVAIGASLYMVALNNVKDLKDNWQTYRCNPAYMPLAGLIGQDPFKNFTDCTMKSFQDYTGFVVDPIMSQFSVMTETVSEIGGAMNDMRSMMADTRAGFLGIVGTVFGKIENLMAQFQYIIIRMRTLMARLVGIMMAFVHIFTTGADTGTSLVNGPVGKTMNFLCFDEHTMVRDNYGHIIYMKQLRLGDKLPNGNVVTSVYLIDGTNVPIYLLGRTRVSGGHKVFHNNEYIPVSQHPYAVRTSDSKLLVCINTLQHSFKDIDGNVFMDFAEDGAVSGLKAETPVANGRAIYEIQVGDVINGDRVRGIVKHAMEDGSTLYNIITDLSLASNKVEKY